MLTYFTVPKGQLTFDAEGAEGGIYHSRKPHVPTDSSGVTIGRGYDLKERTQQSVIKDLTDAGLSMQHADAYAQGVGLAGALARDFIISNKLVEITPEQQNKLFQITYDFMESDCIRICNKSDVVEKYGATDWNTLNSKIKDVVIDLRFRGDYTPESRTFIQKFIADNNLDGFTKVMLDKSKWQNVPVDRFNRRVQYLTSVI